MLQDRPPQIGRHLREGGVECILRLIPLCRMDQFLSRIETLFLPPDPGQSIPFRIYHRIQPVHGFPAHPECFPQRFMEFQNLYPVT